MVACFDVWLHRATNIPTYLHTYKHTYIHTYIPTYIRTYMRMYTHVYTVHTYIPDFAGFSRPTSAWQEISQGPHVAGHCNECQHVDSSSQEK